MHLVVSVHVYSLKDLVQIHNGDLLAFVKASTLKLMKHIQECERCKLNGHTCIVCKSDDIIYPYELTKVTQCPNCNKYYHLKCFDPKDCKYCEQKEAQRYKEYFATRQGEAAL